MKVQKNANDHPWLFWIRIAIAALTGMVALLWISSYFVGIQRYQSDWSSLETATSERATWLVSNYGSLGIAWRVQDGELGSPLPLAEYELKTFDASPTALNNVHPGGFFRWHWIHYEHPKSKTMGLMLTGYGHLYVPYWIPFLTGGLLVFSLTLRIKRRANRRMESNGCPASSRKTWIDICRWRYQAQFNGPSRH